MTDSYNKKIYNSSSPSNLRREYYNKQQVLYQFLLNYNREFNELHNISATVGWEGQRRNGDNFYAVRDLAFSNPYLLVGVTEGQIGAMNGGDLYEYTNNALVGRVNYSFADRYLIEGQFRYDGSSKFAKGSSVGASSLCVCRLENSEESFVRDTGSP